METAMSTLTQPDAKPQILNLLSSSILTFLLVGLIAFISVMLLGESRQNGVVVASTANGESNNVVGNIVAQFSPLRVEDVSVYEAVDPESPVRCTGQCIVNATKNCYKCKQQSGTSDPYCGIWSYDSRYCENSGTETAPSDGTDRDRDTCRVYWDKIPAGRKGESNCKVDKNGEYNGKKWQRYGNGCAISIASRTCAKLKSEQEAAKAAKEAQKEADRKAAENAKESERQEAERKLVEARRAAAAATAARQEEERRSAAIAEAAAQNNDSCTDGQTSTEVITKDGKVNTVKFACKNGSFIEVSFTTEELAERSENQVSSCSRSYEWDSAQGKCVYVHGTNAAAIALIGSSSTSEDTAGLGIATDVLAHANVGVSDSTNCPLPEFLKINAGCVGPGGEPMAIGEQSFGTSENNKSLRCGCVGIEDLGVLNPACTGMTYTRLVCQESLADNTCRLPDGNKGLEVPASSCTQENVAAGTQPGLVCCPVNSLQQGQIENTDGGNLISAYRDICPKTSNLAYCGELDNATNGQAKCMFSGSCNSRCGGAGTHVFDPTINACVPIRDSAQCEVGSEIFLPDKDGGKCVAIPTCEQGERPIRNGNYAVCERISTRVDDRVVNTDIGALVTNTSSVCGDNRNLELVQFSTSHEPSCVDISSGNCGPLRVMEADGSVRCSEDEICSEGRKPIIEDNYQHPVNGPISVLRCIDENSSTLDKVCPDDSDPYLAGDTDYAGVYLDATLYCNIDGQDVPTTDPRVQPNSCPDGYKLQLLSYSSSDSESWGYFDSQCVPETPCRWRRGYASWRDDNDELVSSNYFDFIVENGQCVPNIQLPTDREVQFTYLTNE